MIPPPYSTFKWSTHRVYLICAYFLILGSALWGLCCLPTSMNPLTLIDQQVFLFFNALLKQGGCWAYWSALLNSENADFAMYIAILGLSTTALMYLPAGERRRESWRLAIYYLLLTIAGLGFKTLVQKCFDFNRLSPTLAKPDAFCLCKGDFPFAFKDSSRRSFPGDHALFLFSWAMFWSRNYPRWTWAGSICIAAFFSLPRLLVSGHWASDLLLGGWLPAWAFAQLLFAMPFWNRLPPQQSPTCIERDQKKQLENPISLVSSNKS